MKVEQAIEQIVFYVRRNHRSISWLGLAGWQSCCDGVFSSVLRIGDSRGLVGDWIVKKVTRQITYKSDN